MSMTSAYLTMTKLIIYSFYNASLPGEQLILLQTHMFLSKGNNNVDIDYA